MAAAVGKSLLASKLGDKVAKAINAHKNDETKFDAGGSLPSGIENGVAKLTECKFDLIGPGKQNAGQPIFMAAGIIVSPDSHEGIPLVGRRTSIIESVFDTPTKSRKTVDDHLAWVMNMMRCLGADTSAVTQPSDLEELARSLKEAGPHFTFRTWKGEKQTTGTYAGKEPRVNESWGKFIEWNGGDAADASNAVQDDTGSDAGAVEDETPAEEAPAEEPAEEPSEEGSYDVDALVAEENGEELTRIAVSLGYTEKQIEKAADWEAVGAMIKAKTDAGDAAEESEEPAADEEPTPEPGDVWTYTPIDPKTKKAAIDPKTKKPKKVSVEIVKVDAKKKTATLKDLATKKAIVGADPKVALAVPFDQLFAG